MTRNEALTKYRNEHRVCPVCYTSRYFRTLAGPFVILKDGIFEVKDINDATCQCGWKGVVDDLVPVRV